MEGEVTMKTTKVEGKLMPAVFRLVDSFLTDNETMRKRKEKQMPKNLFEEFKDWISYNFPGIELTKLEEKILRTLLVDRVPRTNLELAARLKKLLPKPRK